MNKFAHPADRADFSNLEPKFSELENSETGLTLQRMIREVGREIGMRRNFYPKAIAQGRMGRSEAKGRLQDLEAVYALLKSIRAIVDEQPIDPANHGNTPMAVVLDRNRHLADLVAAAIKTPFGGFTGK